MLHLIFKSLLFTILYLSLQSLSRDTIFLAQSAIGAKLECKECHQKIYYEISSSAYQHSNFVQRECNVCHISERSAGLRTGVSENLGEKPHSIFILKSGKEAGIDACLERCHRQGASHPVGVTSKGNIRIPNSLPTAEGNIMTCVTCHTPHGGKAKYLARIDFKRDICVLCHLDKL